MKYVLRLGSPSQRRAWQPVSRPSEPLYEKIPFDDISPDSLTIEGNTFCISGDFTTGRKNIVRMIEDDGGILTETVGPMTDYVIIGEHPSKGWKFGHYGTKIDRALELRTRRGEPLLISEAQFVAVASYLTPPESILNRVLEDRLRSTVLLNDFSDGYSTGWACCVHCSHRSALDIQKTVRTTRGIERFVWTQGKNFEFSIGDTFYDCREAYELPWSEALKYLGFCIKVFQTFADVVHFEILVPNSAKTGVELQQRVSASQAEFVQLLITGSCDGHKLS